VVQAPIANYFLFQIGWFAVVLSAARGISWAGLLVVFLILALHLGTSSRRRQELRLLAAAAPVCLVLDSALIALGFFQPVRWIVRAPLSPLWMISMWINFALTFGGCMRWMIGRHAVSALMGAVGGPLAYLAGQKLGAIVLPENPVPSLVVLATAWMIVMPLLFLLAPQDR
jgi:hypothetical protein